MAEITTFDPRTPRTFWLSGNSVLCACPDCNAPMTIRMWLLAADCWRCGCCVELTAQQERQLQHLLRSSETSQQNSPPIGTPALPVAPVLRQSSSRGAESRRPRTPALPATMSIPTRLLPSRSTSHLRDRLRQTPAWFVSLLFHMALLALLALLFFEADSTMEDFYITLSTEANRMNSTGGELRFRDPDPAVQFDMPIPDPQSSTRQQRATIAKANQDARELRVDPTATRPELPSLKQVKQTLQTGTATQRAFSARDPRVRAEIVAKEGGTTLTEAAVARGLRWMAAHQNQDGSWSLNRFHKTPSCRARCSGRGIIDCDSAATSLCLLPFLGAGQTHQTGIYQEQVAKGLRWLLKHQAADGDLRVGQTGEAGMYAHGQGAIVLCEAFALTRDEQFREAAQRAIDFIVNAQDSGGGWRYHPGQVGDTSVLGWQLMAFQSARSADLHVPIESWELANMYLDSVASNDGSRYAYQPERRPTHVMTAEALLCRMYLGWSEDYAPLQQGVSYLLRRHMPRDDGPNFYYWYYATQVLHHYGGKRWQAWNISMRDVLVESQVKSGHAAGSWDPRGGHAAKGGRIYATALATCTLEVYYRHAPIFRQIDLAANGNETGAPRSSRPREPDF